MNNDLIVKRCNMCRYARSMPDIRVHLMCKNDGAIVSSFEPACENYDPDTRRFKKGNMLWKRLEDKNIG